MTALRQVAQRATDLDASTAFYRDRVGLSVIATFDPPGLVFLDAGGGLRLMLAANAPSATLYFTVDDVELAVEELRGAGVPVESEPHVIFRDDAGQFGPAGQEERMAFVRDPSGNLVGLVDRR